MDLKDMARKLDRADSKGLNGKLGIVITQQDPCGAEGFLRIEPGLYQPFGFLHGGATLALLEAVASRAVDMRVDLEVERPFGIEVNIRHWKPGKEGILRGIARLDHEEGSKQFWKVQAIDDEGDIVSDGIVVTKIVSLERLAEKERKRAEKRS